jgi:LuxR family maltose regulon positive regulatory protein
MDVLLQAAVARADSPAADHAAELLRVAGRGRSQLDQPPSQAAAEVAAGGEGLSDRELEVLRLLASDLTGPEIAQHLFVSVNTLRSHTRHIFTKLDVNTRRAAVRRATDLGLL